MSDHPWQDFLNADIRETLLAGDYPDITLAFKPALIRGDRIILKSAYGKYPSRWITIVKISKVKKQEQWIITYSILEPPTLWLRKNGGTTPDRINSIDDEIPFEDYEPLPNQVSGNTLARERRRVEAELARHERKLRHTSNPEAKRRLPAKIAKCREILASLGGLDDAA